MLASLDGYTLFIGQQLVPVSQFVEIKGTVLCIQYFIESLAKQNNFPEYLKAINGEKRRAGEPNISLKSGAALLKLKCSVIVRILDFVKVSLSNQKDLPETLKTFLKANESVYALLLNCILRPHTLGFNLGDKQVEQELLPRMMEIFSALHKHLSNPEKDQFISLVQKEISVSRDEVRNILSPESIQRGFGNGKVSPRVQYLKGLASVCQSKSMAQSSDKIKRPLASQLLDSACSALFASSESPTTSSKGSYAQAFLDISLQLNPEVL